MHRLLHAATLMAIMGAALPAHAWVLLSTTTSGPLTITLSVDSQTGCGGTGIACPAGQIPDSLPVGSHLAEISIFNADGSPNSTAVPTLTPNDDSRIFPSGQLPGRIIGLNNSLNPGLDGTTHSVTITAN